MAGRTLAPIIAYAIGKQISLSIEIGARNWSLKWVEGLESLLIILVPKVYEAVGTRFERETSEKGHRQSTLTVTVQTYQWQRFQTASEMQWHLWRTHCSAPGGI